MGHDTGKRRQIRDGLNAAGEGFICLDELDVKLRSAAGAMATGDSKELKRSLYEGRIFARFANRECPYGHIDLGHGESTRNPATARLAAGVRGDSPTPWANALVAEPAPVAAPQAELPLSNAPRILFTSSGRDYALTLAEAKQLRADLNTFFEG